MGILFTLVLLACVAGGVVWSVFMRKLPKTRIASICSIASIVIAVAATLIVKDVVTDPKFFTDTIMPALKLSPEIQEMFEFSITLRETIIGLPVAFIMPLVFVVVYLVARILTAIVYFVIVLIAGRRMRKQSKRRPVAYATARTIAWSTAAGLLTLVVVLIPVAFYGGMSVDVFEFAATADLMGEDSGDDLAGVAEDYITPIVESPIVESFRALGGDLLLSEMTSFQLNGELINVSDELDGIFGLANSIAPLMGEDLQNLSGEDADKIVGVSDALANSKFLSSIMAEAIYYLTGDIVNGDEPLTLDESGMFDDLADRIVGTLYEDAEAAVRPKEGTTSEMAAANMKQFTDDIHTVAELTAVILKSGLLSDSGNTEELLNKFTNGTTVHDMIFVLGENERLKCLVPEVVNIGIKAIASFMEVKDSAGAVYDELMATIAADLNGVKDLDDATKVKTLSPKLNDAFDHAGIVIDKQVLDLYSVAMIYELVNGNDDEITAADVTAFFVAYAEGAENENATGTPAVLAQMILELSALKDAKSETFQDDVASILASYGETMLGTTEGALYEKVAGVKLKRILDSNANDYTSYSTAENAASLQSAEEMAKTTFLRTRDILLIDAEEAAAKITDKDILEAEANAIQEIFKQAGTLMNDVSGEINISTMAGSVGEILNAFNGSVCVGPERTSNLFISILQSPLVRDAAKMDIFTATDLAYRGSTGESVNYAQTFTTISNTMDVLQNMNSNTEGGGMSVETLTTVFQDMNSQTAGMMESYITEERLSDEYGLDAEQSETAAPLISDVFGYWNEPGVAESMTPEKSKQEAEALNDVMNLVTSASDKANSGESSQTVFGEGNDSVLGKTASQTVETFMASDALKHSLNKNSENGTLEEDPFGMGDMMVNDEENSETQDLKNAMKNYYETTEYETEEEKKDDEQALTNLGKLFGFSEDEMKDLLGGQSTNP